MSMPGFVFHFKCDACDKNSGDYSLYPAPSLFSSNVSLPTWSVENKCWGILHLDLTADKCADVMSDSGTRANFARSLSNDSITVAIQLDRGLGTGRLVDPNPICPFCGMSCEAILGYAPVEEPRHFPEVETTEEFRAIPLSILSMSVRTRNTIETLGLRTLGEVLDRRSELPDLPRVAESVIAEINSLLARNP